MNIKKPFVLLFVCVVIIIVAMNRTVFFERFSINGTFLSKFLSVLLIVLSLYSLLGLEISLIQIGDIFKARMQDNKVIKKNIKRITIDKILSELEKNDIIEFEIYKDDELIEFGASADSNPADKGFFNKKYYVYDLNHEFDSLIQVHDILVKLSDDGKNLNVVSVDGIFA